MTTWRDAFLLQAGSDFDAALLLADHERHASQGTMLLQMAWEKLAKAALVGGGGWSPARKTHAVAAKFASALKKAPRAAQVFGLTNAQWAARLIWLQSELEALETLTPAVAAGGPNAEYPWEAVGTGGVVDVFVPVTDLGARFCGASRGAIGLRKDFRTIEGGFGRLFGAW